MSNIWSKQNVDGEALLAIELDRILSAKFHDMKVINWVTYYKKDDVYPHFIIETCSSVAGTEELNITMDVVTKIAKLFPNVEFGSITVINQDMLEEYPF